MGWTSCDAWTTKKAIREDILSDYKSIVAHKATKSGLWAVMRSQETQEMFLVLFLIERSGGIYAYKDMDESMHPFYYDCPADLVAMVPAPARPNWIGNDRTWRDVWQSKQVG